MLRDNRVAGWVKQHRKAPRIAEGKEVGLSGIKVDEERLPAPTMLASTREVVDLAPELGIEQTRPHQVVAAISVHLEVGQKTVDALWLGGQDVYGVHIGVRFAALLDALDSYWGGQPSDMAGDQQGEINILAMLLLRRSSSLTDWSMIALEIASTIRHFHYLDLSQYIHLLSNPGKRRE